MGNTAGALEGESRKLTDLFPAPAWALIIEQLDLKHIVIFTMCSKMCNEAWRFVTALDAFEHQLPSSALNRYLKKLLAQPSPNTTLKSLMLYNGQPPRRIWFERKIWKQLPNLVGLTSLSFGNRSGGLENLRDESLTFLSSLTNLTLLNLNHCSNITEVGYRGLATLTKLRALCLRRVEHLEGAMQHLNAPHLNILDISEAFQFNINCATKLATLTNLQYLDVGGVEIRGKSWNAIDFSKFTKLLHLNLENNHFVQDKTIQEVVSITNLRHLHLRHCSRASVPPLLSYRTLLGLSRLTNLVLLSLEACAGVTDQVMESVGKLTRLRLLNLRKCCMLTDAGIAHLSSLKHLQILYISRNSVSRGLRYLTTLQELQQLQLMKLDELEDDDLEPLRKLRRLKDVDLILCDKLTLNCVAHLRHVSRIRHTIDEEDSKEDSRDPQAESSNTKNTLKGSKRGKNNESAGTTVDDQEVAKEKNKRERASSLSESQKKKKRSSLKSSKGAQESTSDGVSERTEKRRDSVSKSPRNMTAHEKA